VVTGACPFSRIEKWSLAIAKRERLHSPGEDPNRSARGLGSGDGRRSGVSPGNEEPALDKLWYGKRRVKKKKLHLSSPGE
jgi:hypothetical protein